MSTVHHSPGRRSNIDDTITDNELRRRIADLQRFDKLTQPQAAELSRYEQHLIEREQTRRDATLARQLGISPERLRSGETLRPAELGVNPGALERAQTETPAPEPVRRGRERHAEARRILDRSKLVDEASKDLLGRTVEADPTSTTAEYVAATSSEHYARAFAKVLADPMNGQRSFTTEELHAWQRADAVRALTTVTGDALIPTHLDPSIIITNAGVIDPIRSLARVVQLTVGGTWHGVSSAGVSAEWLAESAEAADATPTLDDPEVETHKADVYVEATIEALQDAATFQSELGRLFADAKANHEAAAWIDGTGVGQPQGILTGLAAGQTVNTATADAFAAEDVYALQEALPPRFRANATWLAALGILNAADQFETTGGMKRFAELANDRLLRKPVSEASTMSETIATGEHILLFGDFRHYLIADRLGAAVELNPMVLGANRRPVGRRGFWFRWRVGGGLLVPDAFRRLAVA